MIDGLEYLLVEVCRLGAVERQTQSHERVGETLDTNANWAMAHVGLAGLGDRVVIHVDDAVEIECDDLADGVKLLEVVLFVGGDEGGESDGGEVANSDFVGGGVLDDLGTQVGRLDGAKVLLVRLAWVGGLWLAMIEVPMQ